MDIRSSSENSHVGTNIILEREEKISIKKTTNIYVERKQTRVRQLHNSTARNHKDFISTENNLSKQTTTSRAKRLQRNNFQLQALNQRIENEINKLEQYREHLLSCQKKKKQTQSGDVETNKQSEETLKEMTWRESLAANKSNTNCDEIVIKPRMRAVGLQEIKECNNTVTYNCVRLEQKLQQQTKRETPHNQNERHSAGCSFGHSNQMHCSVYECDYSANVNCCNYQPNTCPHCSSQRYGGYYQQPTANAYQYCVTPTVCMASPPPPISPHCNVALCYCPPTTRRCGTDLNTEDFCRNRPLEENLRNERSRSRSSSVSKPKDKDSTRSTLSRAKSKSKSQTRSQKPKSDERADKLLPQGLSDIRSLEKYRVQNKEKLIKVTLKRASDTSAIASDNVSSVQGMIITEYKSAAEAQAEDRAKNAAAAAADTPKTKEEKNQMYQEYLKQYKAETSRKSMTGSLIAMGPTPVSKSSLSTVRSHESAAAQKSGNVELRSDKTYAIIPQSDSLNSDKRPDVNKMKSVSEINISPQTRTETIDPTKSKEQIHGIESSWEQKQATDQDYSKEYSESYGEKLQTISQEKEQQQEIGYPDSIDEEEPQTARQQQQQHATVSYKDQQQTTSQEPQQQAINQLYSRTYADSYGEQSQPCKQQQQIYGQQQPQIPRQQQLQIHSPQQHITGQISSVTYIKQVTKIRKVEKPTQTEFDLQPLHLEYCPREIFDIDKQFDIEMQCPCPRRYERTYRIQPSYERRLSHSNQPRYEDQQEDFRYEDETSSKQRPNHEGPLTSRYSDQRNQLMNNEEEQQSLSSNRSSLNKNRRLAIHPDYWDVIPKPHDRTDTRREGSIMKYSAPTENSQQMPNYDPYRRSESEKIIPQSREISPGYVDTVDQPLSDDSTSSSNNQQTSGMPQTQAHHRSPAYQETLTPAQNLNYYHIENPTVMPTPRLVNLPEEECCSITSMCKSYEQVVCTTKRSKPCGNGNEDLVRKNITPITTEISSQLQNVNSTNYASVNRKEDQNGQPFNQTDQEITSEIPRQQPKTPEAQEYTMKSTIAAPEPVRSVQTTNEQTMAKPITTEVGTSTLEIGDPISFVPKTCAVETQVEQTNSMRTKRRSVDFAAPATRSMSNFQRAHPNTIQHTASAPSQCTLNHRPRGNPRYQSRQQMESEYYCYSSPSTDDRFRSQPSYRSNAFLNENETYSSSSPSTPVTAYRRNCRGRPMARQRSEQMSPNQRQSPCCRRNCEIIQSTETIVSRRSPIDWERCRRNAQMPKHRVGNAWQTSDARPTSDYGSTEEDFIAPCKTHGSCSTLQTCRDSDYGDYMTCDESQGEDNNCKQLPEFKGCACMYDTYLNMAALCAPRQQQQLTPNTRNHQIQDTSYARQQQHSFY